MSTHPHLHQVIIVGAGPGGIAVAAALKHHGITDVVMLDKGEIGQSWLEYPEETRLLSESSEKVDDNMIAGVPVGERFPNIPHPSHLVYQKYLAYVVEKFDLKVVSNVTIERVSFDPLNKQFLLRTATNDWWQSEYLVWAAGMYSTPNQSLDVQGCYVHYAHLPYMEKITSDQVTVVGSANGASTVVIELAKPGRVVTLVTSHEYVVPQPIDCLWKEQMEFVKNLEQQGMVKIVPNFRVKRIFKEHDNYIIESEMGDRLTARKRPIVCTGFGLNTKPISDLVCETVRDKETFLDLTTAHESTKQPGMFVAGTLGKLEHEKGFIRHFRDFAPQIAKQIHQRLTK